MEYDAQINDSQINDSPRPQQEMPFAVRHPRMATAGNVAAAVGVGIVATAAMTAVATLTHWALERVLPRQYNVTFKPAPSDNTPVAAS